MTPPRLTRAQRKELRRRGPFRNDAGDLRATGGGIVAEFRYAVHEAAELHGAIVAALNDACEPGPVARAKEALETAALAYDRRPADGDRHSAVLSAALALGDAVKAAKKEKGR